MKTLLTVGNVKRNKSCEDLRVDGVIMLKWIVQTGGARAQTGLDS
jgi:hypothetical protein